MNYSILSIHQEKKQKTDEQESEIWNKVGEIRSSTCRKGIGDCRAGVFLSCVLEAKAVVWLSALCCGIYWRVRVYEGEGEAGS
ncbi:hypothetical protein SLA2020_159720 [Shorea laevis]